MKVKAQAAELSSSKKSVQELDMKVKAQGTGGSKKTVQDLDLKVKAQAAELRNSNHRVQELELACQRIMEMQREMQRETQRSLREMDKFKMRCFSTGDTRDQEHDD
ncbi:uncharacterized protein [Watersipora subatra]|uniref:uncharacterized protein n=1 Tax=Watersipora subatra TaxID=2589382 RepID=UPI00355C2FD4